MYWATIIADTKVDRQIEGQITIQIIVAVSAMIVALLGFLGVIWQHRKTRTQVERVYDHLNNVEVEVATDGSQTPTIGQIVMSVDKKVTKGFEANERQHAELWTHLASQGRELAATSKALVDHDAWSRERLEELRQADQDLRDQVATDPPGQPST